MSSPDLMELVSKGLSKGGGTSFLLLGMFLYISLLSYMAQPSKYFDGWLDAKYWDWKKHGRYYLYFIKFAPLVGWIIGYGGHGGFCEEGVCSSSTEITSPDEDFVYFIQFTLVMLVVSIYAAKVRLNKYVESLGTL